MSESGKYDDYGRRKDPTPEDENQMLEADNKRLLGELAETHGVIERLRGRMADVQAERRAKFRMQLICASISGFRACGTQHKDMLSSSKDIAQWSIKDADNILELLDKEDVDG